MIMHTDTIEFPTNIDLSDDPVKIAANRRILDDALTQLGRVKVMLASLQRANQGMCKHPNAVAYADPREPGAFDCPACGATR